jgi:hypothetical protein
MAEIAPSHRKQVDLVTCGSPLVSLYAVFFPRQFSGAFFDEVRANSRSWANFWRDTDPIATPVGAGHDEQIPDPNPEDVVRVEGQKRPLHVHGDYWIAPQQQDYIAGLMGQPRPPRGDLHSQT